MSPIRPSEKKRYPKDWRQIAERIKRRAQDRCECLGECGGHAAGVERCPERQYHQATTFNGTVVLTVAHLDHTPENCANHNLKAMCQRCHLRYDRDHHAKNAAATREAKNPQLKLGLEGA